MSKITISESLESAIEKLKSGDTDSLTPEEKEDLRNEYFPKTASARLHNIKRDIDVRRKNNWYAQEDEDGNIIADNPDYVEWKKSDDDIRRKAADYFYPNEADHAACEGKISDDKEELEFALKDDGFKQTKSGEWWAPEMYPGLKMKIVKREDGQFEIKKLEKAKSMPVTESTIRIIVKECVRRVLN